jgi:hypothetical protein
MFARCLHGTAKIRVTGHHYAPDDPRRGAALHGRHALGRSM